MTVGKLSSLIVLMIFKLGCFSQFIPVHYDHFHVESKNNLSVFEISEPIDIAYLIGITDLDTGTSHITINGIVYMELIGYDGWNDSYTCGESG